MEAETVDGVDSREELQLAAQIAVLRRVPGASCVSTYNRNKPGCAIDINKIGFLLKLDTGSGAKLINVHFT